MEIVINAVIVHNPLNIENIFVNVNEGNHRLIREKLIFERNKLITYINKLKKDGIIKSSSKPKHKAMQDHLDEICHIKKEIKKTIQKIDTIYA